MYAVLNAQGELVEVTGDVKAAVKVAEHVARGRNVWVDVPAQGYAPNRAELIQLPGRDMPRKAMEATGLPQVRWKDITEITDGFSDFRQAHALLKPHFAPMDQFETPHKMADGMLGQNYKLSEQIEGFDGIVMGLSLTPYWKGVDRTPPDKRPPRGTRNLCVGSNAECRAACLVLTGQNVSTRAQQVKFEKTAALFAEPVAFCAMLALAIYKFARYASKERLQPFLRLNVYSDIPWELFCPDLFKAFPAIGSYDYSKVAYRHTPANYDLTFSFSGSNEKLARGELSRGRRVAVVFMWKKGKPFPPGFRFWDHDVVDGDVSDLRPLDPSGYRAPLFGGPDRPCVVGLRFKPPKGARQLNLGSFVVPVVQAESGLWLAPHSARQAHAEEFD